MIIAENYATRTDVGERSGTCPASFVTGSRSLRNWVQEMFDDARDNDVGSVRY